MGGQLEPEAQENLKSAGVPNYFDPARAVRALSALVKYGDIKHMDRSTPADFPVQREKAEKKIEKLRQSGDQVIGLGGLKVLDHYGIPTIPAKIAKSPEEAADIAEKIGSLVVLKVDSPQIVHKSDAGGVKIGVEPADVAWEYRSMIETLHENQPGAEINGIRVQEMVEGEEVIVGLKRDPQFGPLVMFGLGGIYVEVLKDVSFRVAPVSTKQASKMVESINGYPILEGVRGKEGVEIDSLVDIVQKVSKFAIDQPEIGELDLNPVMASAEGARVADVRFRFSQ